MKVALILYLTQLVKKNSTKIPQKVKKLVIVYNNKILCKTSCIKIENY